MQDFYLDLVEDNRKIAPRDYLELALRPIQGGGRDVAAKNEVLFIFMLLFFSLQLMIVHSASLPVMCCCI